MTISADNLNPFPAFGVRLRGANNTADFMSVEEDGTVTVGNTQLERKLSTDPTTLTFVFRNHPTNTAGATLLIDVYVNGQLAHSGIEYAPGSNYRVSDIIRLYILFGAYPDEDIVRNMYIKDLTVYDGEEIPVA